MMRLIFGALLALLVLYPAATDAALTVATHPAALAFAAGVWAWPRIAQRIKGWTA
ncbi:hypothetical protein IGX29_26110 [Streptomyces sp. H28]|uniref:hypothetical protein n=1 Tax=Streptomyces sp. H28 TaxID=2775865 RepID=UPI0017809E27|nr:hypothetical protein [Streptomyces sp. H28]MBD9735216.1 hypothetical protein [Streptomyces sp. H28]